MDSDRRKNLTDYINDIYGKAQAARLILGWGIIGWPFAIAIVVIVVISIIVILPGGPGAASEILPQQAQQTTGTVETSSLFNLIGATQTSEEFIEIQNILAPALSYPNYKKLLTEGGLINLTFDDAPRCGARVNEKGDITFFSFEHCTKEFRRYAFLHETGHIIAVRNEREWQSFDFLSFKRGDPSCYTEDGYLISYPYARSVLSPKGEPKAESFAESIALFLVSKEPLENFSTQCPNTYNWVRENIFK